MPGFGDPLTLTPTEDGDHWRLDTPFDYWTGPEGNRLKIEVPEGFVTDLASIPRIFWNILPPFGKYTGAAVIHDWLYTCQTYTREWSDGILLEAMGVLGVPWLTKKIIYRSVRMFGWMAWNKKGG